MKNIKDWEKESLINYWWIFYYQKIFFNLKIEFFRHFLMNFDGFFNVFLFYSILAGWSTWQWVFLNFSQNFWSFDTPDTPGCASAVIWNRFEPFLLQCRSCSVKIYFKHLWMNSFNQLQNSRPVKISNLWFHWLNVNQK